MLYSPTAHVPPATGFFFDEDPNAPADAFPVADVDVHDCINAASGSTWSFTAPTGSEMVGTLTLTAAPAPTAAQKLQDAKDTQNPLIKQACSDAINAGFTFTAGGKTYTATLSLNDQANLARNSAVALGVPTKAQPWASGMTVPARGLCADGGEFYISTAGGTAGTTKPTWPTAFGTPVTDGTAQWELFGLQVDTTTGRIRVTYAEFLALFEQFSEFMDSALGKCTALLNQIANATTQTAVKGVTW